jgi:hypothetical protein
MESVLCLINFSLYLHKFLIRILTKSEIWFLRQLFINTIVDKLESHFIDGIQIVKGFHPLHPLLANEVATL